MAMAMASLPIEMCVTPSASYSITRIRPYVR